MAEIRKERLVDISSTRRCRFVHAQRRDKKDNTNAPTRDQT
jgi:hypothetical protein